MPLKLFRGIGFCSESGVCDSLDAVLDDGVVDCEGCTCAERKLGGVPDNSGGKNSELCGETSSNIRDIPNGILLECIPPITAPFLILFQINSCDFSAFNSICNRPGGAVGIVSKKGPPLAPKALPAIDPK